MSSNKVKGMPTPRQLYNERERKSKIFLNACSSVLNTFADKITEANKKGKTTCVLAVPLSTSDPLYRPDFCLKYVINDLLKKDYKVVFRNPNFVYVSWNIDTVPPLQSDDRTDHINDIKDINISDLAKKYEKEFGKKPRKKKN